MKRSLGSKAAVQGRLEMPVMGCRAADSRQHALTGYGLVGVAGAGFEPATFGL